MGAIGGGCLRSKNRKSKSEPLVRLGCLEEGSFALFIYEVVVSSHLIATTRSFSTFDLQPPTLLAKKSS